ncbi:MAG TPA: hypothetical protein HA257_06185 [Candidatus Methanoperedenaceae archaeon]|nr:hypothetical protein [Candidatus Methanoperedenaceae archaeon]
MKPCAPPNRAGRESMRGARMESFTGGGGSGEERGGLAGCHEGRRCSCDIGIKIP